MHTRDDTATDLLYDDCPGYHFCKEILKVNQAINTHAKEEKSILKIQDIFNDAYSKLEPAMYAEEDSREELQMSATLCRYLNNHENEKRELTEEINIIEKDYQVKLDNLKRQKTDITNSIQIEVAKDSAQQVKDEKEYFNAFSPLNIQVHKYEEQYKLKQQEIDVIMSKCCSFLCANATKEQKELADIKVNIDLTYGNINELEKKKLQKTANTLIKKLEEQRDTIIKQLENLIKTEYPNQKDNAQKKLDDAIVKYKDAKTTFDRTVQQHYSVVSKKTILMYLRSYVCFIKLKQATETAWAEKFKASKGTLPADDNLALLKMKQNEIKTKLDEWMNILRHNRYSARNAMDLFQNYDDLLTEEEKNNFLNDTANSSYEKKLIPSEGESSKPPTLFTKPVPSVNPTVPLKLSIQP